MKLLNKVLIKLDTVSTVALNVLIPGFNAHFTSEYVVHCVVVQAEPPMEALGVTFTVTKLLPTNVMLLVPEAAPFGRDNLLMIGESYVKTFNAVPISTTAPPLP